MRVQVLSDLHFEFHRDGGKSFVESLDPSEADVLLLAGDVAVGEEIPAALGLVCRRYARAEILYVHGNHEFYGTGWSEVHARTQEVARRHRNLHWLSGSVVEIGGVRFLGSTLWFPYDPQAVAARQGMNDFFEIRDFESWVWTENRRAVRFFEKHLRPGDVVITHHLPSWKAVAPEYRGSPLNAFFVCDLEALILERQPRLWVFGHTHESCDLALGATRLLCNPFGYAAEEENGAFEEKLVVEL